MDCMMPVMDGYTATRRLRAKDTFKTLPIIAMSANAMQEDRDKAVAAGMNDYIVKPVDTHILFGTLAKWIHPTNRPVSEGLTPPSSTRTNDHRRWRLEHLDAAAGLRRIGGDQGTYQRLLQKFAENQSEAIDVAAQAQEEGNQELSLRLMHTLKSAAGAIGATALQALAAESERRLKERPQLLRLPGEADLRTALSLVLDDIAAIGPAEKTQGKPPATGNEQVQGLLLELWSRLEEYDAEAQETLDKLLGISLDIATTERLNAVTSAMDQYDFELAAERLKPLLEKTDA
jgi:CheY-like chemotaxis protein